MRLEGVKEGDAVALYTYGAMKKMSAGRGTATRVYVDGQAFVRRTGRPVGSPWAKVRAEAWTEDHDRRLLEQRKENRLLQSRHKLAEFAWRHVTQEQADAVLAAMAKAGMLEPAAAECPPGVCEEPA